MHISCDCQVLREDLILAVGNDRCFHSYLLNSGGGSPLPVRFLLLQREINLLPDPSVLERTQAKIQNAPMQTCFATYGQNLHLTSLPQQGLALPTGRLTLFALLVHLLLLLIIRHLAALPDPKSQQQAHQADRREDAESQDGRLRLLALVLVAVLVGR